MQRRCRRFRTEQVGGPDLRSTGAERKRSGNAAAVGDPAGGNDRDADRIDDLRHQRHRTRLRRERGIEVGREEHPAMPSGLIALGDDHIDATRFQPARLRHRGRRRHDAATRRLDPGQQCRRGQAEMETHHIRLGVLDHLAHVVAERRKFETGRRRLRLDPERAIVG
jgi:hypothetical protein